MGCSIKFVRLDDFISDIDSIDLSAGGYSLANDGYFQTVAPIGAKSVREVITIKIQGSSKDNLAALIQDIDEKIKQVEWWIDDPGVEKYQVWIRVQLDGETYSRQAQILTIQPPDKVKTFTPTEINNNYIGEYQIGIERTPFWEGATSNEITKSTLDIAGGSTSLSAVPGDVPARMLRLRIGPHVGSNGVSVAWVGFKTARFGTVANFVPNWKLNNGNYAGDTTAVADATTYSGSRLVTTFTFPYDTLQRRTLVTAANVAGSNAVDQRGTYLVLLRAKMSDTSIARARIGYSFDLSYPVYRSRQVISGTFWQFYEMGVVKNPPSRVYNYHNINTFTIQVDAERISGTGDLHLDCLVLIPIDDGAVRVTTGTNLSAAASQKAAIFQAADNSTFGLFENGSDVYYSAIVTPQNGWALPNDAGPVIVCAAASTTGGCIKNSTVDILYTYITRWRTMRGNTA